MKKFIVFFAAIAMVGAFAFSAVAADWAFYGSSRMTTVSYDKSKEVAGTNYDDQDTTWASQTNSRLGAKVDAGDVKGVFEMAMSSTDEDEVALRLFYGTWNFGSGTLLVGQDYGPVNTILSASIGTLPSNFGGTDPVADGEGSALQIGSVYLGRLPQIGLKFGSFEIAFISPSTVGTTATYTDIDTTLPKIEASYNFKTDMFSVTPYGGWNKVDFANTADDTDVSIDSYIYGVTATVNMGAAYIKGNIYGAQNSGNYGKSNISSFDTASISGTTVNDSDEWGGILLVGFKMNDMLTFEAGYAMEKNELDAAGIKSENDPTHWYVNATITLAPGVMIVPEIGKFDLGTDKVTGQADAKQGDVTYFGAKWQINF